MSFSDLHLNKANVIQGYILNYKRNPSVTFWGNSGKIIKKQKCMFYDILKQTIMHQFTE